MDLPVMSERIIPSPVVDDGIVVGHKMPASSEKSGNVPESVISDELDDSGGVESLVMLSPLAEHGDASETVIPSPLVELDEFRYDLATSRQALQAQRQED